MGQSNSRLSFESRILPRRRRAGQLEPVAGRAAQLLGAPRSGRAPRPPGIGGAAVSPGDRDPRVAPATRGGTGVRATPLSARRERDGVCRPAQPAPRPGRCYRLGREAAPGAAPAPCWRSVAPSAGAAARMLRGPASALLSPARSVEGRAASAAPGPTQRGSTARP